MHKFKELTVWKKGVDLAVDIYKLTKKFPSEEKYGLTSQINRSAVSIPSNIAEGAGRNTNGEFSHFLGISAGSAHELETQLIIADRIGLLEEVESKKMIQEINDIVNMLHGLQKSLNKNHK